jgi:cytochrome c oxidase subunit 3
MLSQSAKYYIPNPSYYPVIGSTALFCMALGAALWFNGTGDGGADGGKWLVLAGAGILTYMIVGWFTTVAHESEGGKYNKQVDLSFRWGMSWFIFSEVMFFAAFFGALFYMRVLSVPWLGDLDNKLLWPNFTAAWPVSGPGMEDDPFTPMAAWGLPAINTAILLTSGITVTIAHWGLVKNNRSQLIWGLVATVALGVTFLGLQMYEYGHAYSELNLKLSSGAYGSTFFMLTGFHGFHVTVGTIMLIVILGRSMAGHFTPEHHFGFEGVAWYWHFVDVVWLGLFVFVYWLV